MTHSGKNLQPNTAALKCFLKAAYRLLPASKFDVSLILEYATFAFSSSPEALMSWVFVGTFLLKVAHCHAAVSPLMPDILSTQVSIRFFAASSFAIMRLER